jgi:glycosyltransferase involved in cell wall biosynthesis
VVAERVTVVIPCFNARDHVSAAIESALGQREPGKIDVDIVVVDDASTDDTLAVVARLAAAQRGAINVVKLARNRGPAAARNAGLRRAKGRLACFLDADDQYLPLTFARCVTIFARRPQLAAVMFGVELVNCQRTLHPAQREALIYSLPSNMIVRRDVAELLGGFPEDAAFRGASAGEDVAFKRALVATFDVVVMTDECLRHVVRPGSHLDYFLDRSEVVDGKLVAKERSPEEVSGAVAAATARYRAAVARRIAAIVPGAPTPKRKVRRGA